MAVLGPFDKAIEMVRESMEIILPKRSAEEMLIDASADFDDYWKFHVDQDQKRLYPVKWKTVHSK